MGSTQCPRPRRDRNVRSEKVPCGSTPRELTGHQEGPSRPLRRGWDCRYVSGQGGVWPRPGHVVSASTVSVRPGIAQPPQGSFLTRSHLGDGPGFNPLAAHTAPLWGRVGLCPQCTSSSPQPTAAAEGAAKASQAAGTHRWDISVHRQAGKESPQGVHGSSVEEATAWSSVLASARAV